MSKNMDTNQRREYIDAGNEEAMNAYYDLMEDEYDTDDIRDIIRKYPNYFDSYLQAADDLREMGNEEEARALEGEAFERALGRISDSKGNWPDQMWWGVLENRHIIRALATGADNLWKDGKTDQALDVYRKLLHCNLNDNIGARYAIVALRMGLPYEEYMRQVWPQPTVPADHIFKWFDKYSREFPEELKEWRKYCVEELGVDEKGLG